MFSGFLNKDETLLSVFELGKIRESEIEQFFDMVLSDFHAKKYANRSFEELIGLKTEYVRDMTMLGLSFADVFNRESRIKKVNLASSRSFSEGVEII